MLNRGQDEGQPEGQGGSLFQIVTAAFRHRGFSFVRILQRCPEFVGSMFEPWVHDPSRMLMLTHEDGIQVSPALQKIYRNQERHDPSNMNRAREIASIEDPIPVGVLYRNPGVPCYEDLRGAGALRRQGVRLGAVERVSGTRTLRTTGRVAPNENAVYPLVAGADGVVREVVMVRAPSLDKP